MKENKVAGEKPKITRADLEALLIQVERKQLSQQDREKLVRVLDCYQQLVSALMPGKNLSFSRIKKIFYSFFE
jgi:hypothetical protein